MVQQIRNGELDPHTRPYLIGSRLIPLAKPQGGVRPIAIGEVFLKLACMHAGLTTKDKLADWLERNGQFGCSTGGPEVVANVMQARLADKRRPMLAINFDVKNAFNCMDRAHVIRQADKCDALKPARRLVHWAYGGEPTPLWVKGPDDKVVARLSSSQGVRQGDYFGSQLFCTGLDSVLENVVQVFPSIMTDNVLAYADDSYLLFDAASPHVAAVCARFVDELRAIGCDVNLNKTQGLYFHDTPLPPTTTDWLERNHVKLETRAAKVVGAPIGRDVAAMQALAEECARRHDEFFRLLCHNSMPAQEALLLLRVCGLPRFSFMLRVTSQEVHLPASKVFDQKMRHTLLNILGLDAEDFTSKMGARSRLPLSKGGFGLREQTFVSPFAVVSASAQAASHLQRLLPGGQIDPAPLWG